MCILTVQIDQYCEKHDLTIMGYYQANELVESSRYDKLLVLKRIAIFTYRIFDIKTNEYPIIPFFNNILKLTDYKPNYHQNRLQKHIKVFSTSTKI